MDARSLILVALLVSAGMLAGCGNKGDLYLPDNQSQQQ